MEEEEEGVERTDVSILGDAKEDGEEEEEIKEE